MTFQIETKVCLKDGSQQYMRLPAPYDTFLEAYGVCGVIQDQYRHQDMAKVSSRHWFIVNSDRPNDPQYVLGLCHDVVENFDIWG